MRKELNNKKSKVMVVGLVVLSVLGVGFLANCIYRGVTKNRINESFKYGADATGYFELVDTHWNYEEVGGDGIDEVSVKYRNEKWNDFYKELNDIKGVEVIGAYEFVSYDNIAGVIKPNIDVLKIINKHINDKGINPHNLNPNYLKLTEAEEKKKGV